MNDHNKSIEKYLTSIQQECSGFKKVVDTYNTKTLDSTLQGIISRLSDEARKIDKNIASLIG